MIKAFGSILLMYSVWFFQSCFSHRRNADDSYSYSGIYKPVDRYHVPPSSVETGCSSYLFTRFNIKRSATNMFLFFDMLIWRISRLSSSMAIHNQIYSEPTLMIVSSIINSVIRIFLELDISGLYFWIQSLMAVWLLLINLDTALDVFLSERPRK